MSRQKELNFFSFDRHWQRGEDWYGRHFSSTASIRGESSPSYSKFPKVPHVPERMKTLIPSARFIYLVRDPIPRIVSHYMHLRDGDKENRSLNEALSQFEGNQYIDCSRYHMQLEQYLAHFAQSQILVVSTEQLKANRQKTLQDVFRFLNVDESFRSPHHDAIYHVSKPRGAFWRTVERSRFARSIRPYVPRSIVYWAARRGPNPKAVTAVPRRPAARGPPRLSPRGRGATPVPGGSGLRRVVDLTATAAVISAPPPDVPREPTLLGTCFRPCSDPFPGCAVLQGSSHLDELTDLFEAGFPG